jgi:5-methyltetrahydropteroyltriglutamate--homocysteine methyltransferase
MMSSQQGSQATMKQSSQRILTTHTGSLPRPADLQQMLAARDRGESIDRAAFESRVRAAVQEVVQQARRGIDVVNDGEMSKISYSTYVKDRLTGFEGHSAQPRALPPDIADFPGFAARLLAISQVSTMPACNGPVRYRGQAEVGRDLANLADALTGVQVAEAFLTAASPGIIALFLENQFYPTHEAYLSALAEAMKEEYDAIVGAGFLLQLDCPDLGVSRVRGEDWREDYRALHIKALNQAVRDIPPDRLRLHLCRGNYEGPRHRDIPLRTILPEVLEARPVALSFEGANPRHEHEWKVFEEVRLPEGKVIIPGVLDSTTNFIEHPELVAQRIERYASVVGRERVIAGTDCGFATFSGALTVDPDITWAKLAAMVEGAQITSGRLWLPS